MSLVNERSESDSGLQCASDKQSMNLACSHGDCKNCLPKESDKIECKICGINEKINSNENYIQKNYAELFDNLEKQMSEEIRKYKGKLR